MTRKKKNIIESLGDNVKYTVLTEDKIRNTLKDLTFPENGSDDKNSDQPYVKDLGGGLYSMNIGGLYLEFGQGWLDDFQKALEEELKNNSNRTKE